MCKKIVVTFPGKSGTEIPLLYYGAKYFENLGYEKFFVNYAVSEENYDFAYQNAKAVTDKIKFDEYDDIVFIGKSLGTYIACKLKEEYHVSAALILLTPLPETMPYIRRDNDVRLTVIGTKDRYLDYQILQERCEKEQIPCYVEPGVGHRMEVVGDLQRDLEIVRNVIGYFGTEDMPKKVFE